MMQLCASQVGHEIEVQKVGKGARRETGGETDCVQSRKFDNISTTNLYS